MRRIRLLDYLADNHSEYSIPPLPDWAQTPGTSEHDLAVLDLRGFASDGWVDLSEDYDGGANARLTGSGWAFIEDVRAKRADRLQRFQAARDAVLRWLYEARLDGVTNPVIDRFGSSPFGQFYGQPFTDSERDEAAKWLKDGGLIAGSGTMQGTIPRPSITTEGMKVIDSGRSVNDGQPIATASVITHITGDHNTVQAGSPGAVQTVSTVITNDHREQTLRLADTVEQALTVLPPGAATVVDELRSAARPEQRDPGVLRRALETTRNTITSGAGEMVGKALLAGFGGLLAHYGIPVT